MGLWVVVGLCVFAWCFVRPFMIWKRKEVVGLFFFFFSFVWWILVATVEVDANSIVAEVAVTIVVGFCGGCFILF